MLFIEVEAAMTDPFDIHADPHVSLGDFDPGEPPAIDPHSGAYNTWVVGDLNEDGHPDVAYVDTDRDGDIDRSTFAPADDGRQFDTDGDGRADFTGYDFDGDGAPERMDYDRNGDGRVDESVTDLNHDGSPDVVLRDDDFDGLIDYTEQRDPYASR